MALARPGGQRTDIRTANKFAPLSRGTAPAVQESGALFLGLTGSTAQCRNAGTSSQGTLLRTQNFSH